MICKLLHRIFMALGKIVVPIGEAKYLDVLTMVLVLTMTRCRGLPWGYE